MLRIKFRFETPADVDALFGIDEFWFSMESLYLEPSSFSGGTATMVLPEKDSLGRPWTVERVKTAAELGTDLHVIAETVATERDYTGERTYA